ncbi:MAG: tetratricopeptide repeat protein [Candidatus Hydrogenedentota bacterium]
MTEPNRPSPRRKGSSFTFAHFLGVAALAMMVAATWLTVRWLKSSTPATNPPGPVDSGGKFPGLVDKFKSVFQGRSSQEPRSLPVEPIQSMLEGMMDLPSEESLSGLSVQTRDTLRLRYNLGLVNIQKGDTQGAMKAFASVLEIDPVGAYGRRSFIQMGILQDHAGNFTEAIKLFRKAVELEPLDPLALHNLGVAYLHAGELPSAIEALSRAAQLDGANIGILQNLGNAYVAANKQEEAFGSYRAALNIDTNHAPVLFNLGLLHFLREDYPSAQEAFTQASKGLQGKELARSAAFLGMAEYRRGFFGEAARAFGRAAAEDPGKSDYWFNKGVAHAQSQENYAAADAFRRVLSMNQEDAPAWFGLGGALYLDGDQNGALEAYDKGIAIDSSATAPLFTVGYIHMSRGRIEEAMARFRRITEIGGEDAGRAHVNLGLCYEVLGKFEDAEREYVQGDRGDPRTFYNLGLVRRRLGNIDEAVEAFEKACALSPKEPRYAAALGDAYVELNRPAEAAAEYAKAVNAGAEDFELLVRLAQLSTRLERLTEASDWAVRAMSAARDRHQKALAHISQALIHDKRGDADAALKSLNAGAGEDQRNPDIYFNRGVILSRELRYEEAVDALRTALKLNPRYAAAHTQLGNIFATRGLHEEAVKEYQAAVEIDSAAIEASFNLKELQNRR